VRLESFVPFDEVLPYVRAIVTHGGFGTVGRAFRLGVPMLIISEFGDSVATAVRAGHAFITYLRTKPLPKRFNPNSKLCYKTMHYARVKALSEKLRSMDSPELAANAIEGILQIHTHGEGR